MARTVKSRREAYDDIALGGGTAVITTRERTISGALPPSGPTNYGNTENIAVAADYGAERIIQKTTTLLAGERLG